jgi:putative ABC transport system ATP-binding protein
MVTHSTRAASCAKRVLFIKDGVVFHELYRGTAAPGEFFGKISDTLMLLSAGGEAV